MVGLGEGREDGWGERGGWGRGGLWSAIDTRVDVLCMCVWLGLYSAQRSISLQPPLCMDRFQLERSSSTAHSLSTSHKADILGQRLGLDAFLHNCDGGVL